MSVTDTVCDGISDTLMVYIQRNPSQIGEIISPADTFFLGQEMSLQLEVDTLYQFANWEFDDGTLIDTISADTQVRHIFNCEGWHKVFALAYDTGTVCSDTRVLIEKDIFIKAPEVDIINVTRSAVNENALDIHINFSNTTYYNKKFYLHRRISGMEQWHLIGTFDSDKTTFTDTDVDINKNIYEYQVLTNIDCENQISSEIHQSIVLESEQTDDEATLTWSEYRGWDQGVEHYEVWVDIDSAGYKLLEKTSNAQLDYPDKSEGFDHCFRIIAVERNGNKSSSMSNSSCVAFIPKIKTYNVITPNRPGYIDEFNEYFTIDN